MGSLLASCLTKARTPAGGALLPADLLCSPPLAQGRFARTGLVKALLTFGPSWGEQRTSAIRLRVTAGQRTEAWMPGNQGRVGFH